MARLKGAYMGYNSLDPPMELWLDARWGNLIALLVYLLIISFIYFALSFQKWWW